VVTIITRANESLFQQGQITYQGQSLDEIVALFPNFLDLTLDSIEDVIGIYFKKEDNIRKAKQLRVISLDKTATQIIIRFSIVSDLNISSGDFYKRLRGQIIGEGAIEKGAYLPFCCVLASEEIRAIMKLPHSGNSALKNEINLLKTRSDWGGIYNKFSPLDCLSQPPLWTDAEILSEVGFACGKLAEVSVEDLPRKEPEKTEFLNCKSKYRREAEMLRQRCVELMPNNPTYLANLAYLHYENAMELKTPRNRRDGKLRQEAERAIEYYDMAISLAPNRIKDHYRKGYLLAEVLPNTYWKERNLELAKQKRLEGIESFEKALQIWESLDPSNPQQNRERSRCRKEYIKSLYSIGSAYYQMIVNEWDKAVFALRLRHNIREEDSITYVPKDLENANNAWRYFYKCWEYDRPDGESATTAINGVCEGVDKLYSLGKTAFVQYWILSGYGQLDKPEAIDYRDKAEKYLVQSLNLPCSQGKQREKKDYIPERLARLYITKEEYAKAIQIIEKYRNRKLDSYVIHTLSLALILSGRAEQAEKELQEALKDKGNVDKTTSKFLIGCSFLGAGKFDRANQVFQELKQEKEKDIFLIGEAFAVAKLNRTADAIECLRQANERNPWRLSVGKSLEQLSKGKVRAVKPSRSQRALDLESCRDVDVYDRIDGEGFEDYQAYRAAREAVFGYDADDTDETFEEYLDTHGY
jgi:tetratricopeptide (TPR) repeat protein